MSRARGQSVPCRTIGSTLIGLGLVAMASLSFAAGPGPTSAPAQAPHASAAAKNAVPAAPAALIDINSASRAQLKTLPGIGDAQADKIIAGRPYLSKAHLVTEVGLPTGTYLSIKNRIVAVQNNAARVKLKARVKAHAEAQRAQQAQPR